METVSSKKKPERKITITKGAEMENIIIAAILVMLIGIALIYIWKEKKKGKKCISCPYSGTASCHCKSKQ